MKQCLILDTNFIIEYNNNLLEFKKKIADVADILIPQIVLEEVQGQNARSLESDYNKIKGFINKNEKYFNYKENFELEKAIDEKEKGIQDFLELICDKKIINYSGKTLRESLKRAKYKKPPFCQDYNSDKGFKDAILWNSLLEYKDLETYDKVILITNDNHAFHKSKSDLLTEYNNIFNNELIIEKNNVQRVYELIGITEEETKPTSSQNEHEQIKINDFSTLKTELNTVIDKILFVHYEDDFGNDFSEYNFLISDLLSDSDVEKLLTSLDDFLQENTFFTQIQISDLLSRIGIKVKSDSSIGINWLESLYNIYLQVKMNKKLYNPFLNFIKTEFNKVYQYEPKIDEDPFKDFIKNSDDDLPF